MLFRKRKNILIYLALIFGAFGLASGQNACKYINYMENSQTSVYKPKNTQIKRANYDDGPLWNQTYTLDTSVTQFIAIDVYSSENDNGGVLAYDSGLVSGDYDYSSEFTNKYITYLLFNYQNNYMNLAILKWSNSDFRTLESVFYDTNHFEISSQELLTISYQYGFNYKIATRIFNSSSLLTLNECKNNIENLVYWNNGYIDTQQLSNRISAYQAQVSSLNNQITNLNNQISSLNIDIELLQNQLENVENERDSLRIERDSLLVQKQTLERQVQDLQSQKQALERQVQDLQSQLAQNLPNNIIDWCKIFARGFVDIFNIEMLPNFKVGYLIVAPLLIGIISLFFKLIRGA